MILSKSNPNHYRNEKNLIWKMKMAAARQLEVADTAYPFLAWSLKTRDKVNFMQLCIKIT